MEAYIYDSVRTPRGIGKGKGSLASVSLVQLVSTFTHIKNVLSAIYYGAPCHIDRR